MTTILLGNNTITNCEAALVVNGVEVLRIRERSGDGQLVVDFDVRAEDGTRLAKVAKNNVVHAAPGYKVVHAPSESYVVQPDTDTVIAKVEELSSGTIRITGEFWIDGYHVSITPGKLVAGTTTISGTTVDGFRRALVLRPGAVGIGSG